MRRRKRFDRRPKGGRGGHTLLELLVSSTAGAALLAGLSGSLYIASQSFDRNTGAVDESAAHTILGDMMRDLSQAIRFTERTANAVTFTVPDRTGDAITETIRYAWTGVAGDPLEYTYNGSVVTLASKVENLNFTYLTRAVSAVVPPPPNGADKVLFVVTNGTTPTTQETARQSFLESWGYTVTLIESTDSQANFDTAVAEQDVAYISEEINSSDLGTKLVNATIGIVNEEIELTDEFGFSSSMTWPNESDVTIADNTHYITSEFATGLLTISSAAQSMVSIAGTLAPGREVLGSYGGEPTLVVLTTGAELAGGGTAAGRRVQLPWGGSAFDVNLLTADGRTLWRRALEWASGNNNSEVTGTIAHWKLDESSGAIAADSSGNGHDGSLNGSPTWTPGTIDGSLTFNGSSDYVSVPDSASLQLTDALSITGWINGNSWGAGTDVDIVLRKGESNPNNYQFAIADGRVALYLDDSDGNGIRGSTVLNTGEWYHVAGTWDGDVARIYVNGVLDSSSVSYSGPISTDSRPVYLGGRSGTDYLDGTLDDVRLYGRALSASEIAALASQGTAVVSAGSVVFEEFTEAKVDTDLSQITIPTPPGTSQGDLLIAAVVTDGDTDAAMLTLGWNELDIADQSGNVTMAVWWKLATSSESSTQIYTWSGGEESYGWIMRFTGHDPDNAINAFSVGGGNSDTPTSPAVTTTVDNCMILRIGGFDDDDVSIDDSGLAGHTTITMDESGGGGSSASGGAGYVDQATAGDSGTASFSLTDSEDYRAVTIAIEPDDGS